MKKPVLLLIIALLIGLTVFLLYHYRTRTDHNILLLSGNVEVTETNIGFKLAGRVVELVVDEGDKVKAGDILARLDNAELARVVAQNRASLHEAMERLAELKAGSRPQEIEQARANVSAQLADLDKLKNDYERAATLYKHGAISASQFDASKGAYETRSAQHRNALESLSLATEGPRKEDVRMAEYRVEQSRAALGGSEARLKDTELFAPATGIILRKIVELGETVGQGTPVYTIGDLARPWVKVYVSEEKLGLVKLGQKAGISVDSYRGKTYEGTITYISSEAEFTPKNVQTQEERVKLVFGVKVRVKNENDELKPSMPADVRIDVHK